MVKPHLTQFNSVILGCILTRSFQLYPNTTTRDLLSLLLNLLFYLQKVGLAVFSNKLQPLLSVILFRSDFFQSLSYQFPELLNYGMVAMSDLDNSLGLQ